ncbi:uncharacterized protein KY384_000681 [Bacidia gigantensis]|uniref:uncharacterized protein n=1 Tax=Bacidia gigantensis TaxID=2732470 RepID=UPI001D0428DD|nr:uncharacterized protein KY384_000681 [Bacidia gigantensis]KAG8525919.1 hypothetical protein KY384_000681 [Bacidia gigantensis]
MLRLASLAATLLIASGVTEATYAHVSLRRAANFTEAGGSFLETNGFPAGGGSTCFTGSIEVTVTSTNLKISYNGSPDQDTLTEFNLEFLEPNSDLATRLVSNSSPVTGTYSISSKLCLPKALGTAKEISTVQFLTHGDIVTSTYWNIAPNYSYIDASTAAGYATFSYDRVGTGQSDHPDPISIVQGPLHVEIAHALVTMLRYGQIRSHHFPNVIGVGHSAGSIITQGVTIKFPQEFDAVILTGTSTEVTSFTLGIAAFDFQIANETDPRFKELPNAYFTQANAIGIQIGFFKYPNFDQESYCSFLLG